MPRAPQLLVAALVVALLAAAAAAVPLASASRFHRPYARFEPRSTDAAALARQQRSVRVRVAGQTPVTPHASWVLGETGYLPVSNSSGARAFYWYVPPQNFTTPDVPLIVWLQGGPGCSSMIGMFQENGPYRLVQDEHGNISPVENPYSWTAVGHMLYIDQPVGTGFSYVEDDSDYANDIETVASDLLTALLQFYALHPSLAKTDLFITGESYAGKYIPAFAHAISQYNDAGQGAPVPLRGLAIGDGWTAPLPQTQVYGAAAWNFGLIDANEQKQFDVQYATCQQLVDSEQWAQAQVVCDGALAFIVNASGGIDEDDVRTFVSDFDPLVAQFLNEPVVQSQIGLAYPKKWLACDPVTGSHLAADEMKPTVQLLPDLLTRYRIMLYNGQFDLNCGVAGTEAYLNELAWPQLGAWLTAPKTLWQLNGQIRGYAREVANLTHVVVLGAGHMVPYTQGESAQDMIHRFIYDLSF